MTRPDIAAIRARADAATGGPWLWEDWDQDDGPNEFALTAPPETWVSEFGDRLFPNLRNRIITEDDHEITLADREFIAAARADVPALCDYIKQVEAERDALQARIDAALRIERYVDIDAGYEGGANSMRSRFRSALKLDKDNVK